MGQSKAAPARVKAAERRVKALELRKIGLNFRQIGEQLGVSESAAHKMVSKSLEQLNEKCIESAAEVRRLELERLDDWLVRVNEEAQSGNTLGAIDRGLRIAARRSKLLGLDAPVRLELGEMQNEFIEVLVSAAKAGDPHAAEATRLVSEQKATLLQAWFRWWTRARLPMACTPSDVAQMSQEELAMAAQGKLTERQLEEIRGRPTDGGETAGSS